MQLNVWKKIYINKMNNNNENSPFDGLSRKIVEKVNFIWKLWTLNIFQNICSLHTCCLLHLNQFKLRNVMRKSERIESVVFAMAGMLKLSHVIIVLVLKFARAFCVLDNGEKFYHSYAVSSCETLKNCNIYFAPLNSEK